MRVFGLPAAIPKVIFHADHQSGEYRELGNYLWGIISYFEVIKHELLTTPKRTFGNSVSCRQHVSTSNEVLRTMDVLTTGVAAICAYSGVRPWILGDAVSYTSDGHGPYR